MSGRGRGRGRGIKSKSTPPPIEPDIEAVECILQEVDKAAKPGQFDDSDEKPPPPRASSVQQPSSDTTTRHTGDRGKEEEAPASSYGGLVGFPADKGKDDPPSSSPVPDKSATAAELKASLQSGVQVKDPLSQDSELVALSSSSSKLNPSAHPFTPNTGKGASTLNPNSADFTPQSSTSPSLISKHNPYTLAPSSSPSPSNSSSLNPNSPAFVPQSKSHSWNVTAPEFVPGKGLLPNGDQEVDPSAVSSYLSSDPLPQEEIPFLTTEDVTEGFERPVPLKEDDDNAVFILNASAEMLLKASVIPETFDRHKLKLENRLKYLPPSDEAISNLGAMLVYWGIAEPGLRYTASRMFHIFFETKTIDRKLLLNTVAQRFQKQTVKVKGPMTEELKMELINLAFFAADLYSRLRVGDGEHKAPLGVLGRSIFNLLETLLGLRDEKAIIGVCNVLKLTGSLLQPCYKAEGRMADIILGLQKLLGDANCKMSSSCCTLIAHVRDLYSKDWITSPTSTVPPSHDPIFTPSSAQLPVDSEPPLTQAPVRNPDEWADFLDENDEYIIEEDAYADPSDYPDYSDSVEAADLVLEEEGLDPDMQQEFEAFIQEIEDHLLLQDLLEEEGEEGEEVGQH